MPTTQTEQTAAQKQQADLERARRKREAIKPNKDWLKAFGTIADDEFGREAWSLGEAYRKAQVEP